MNYPNGKLNPTDEGSLDIAVTTEKGRVVVYFREKVKWIGFDSDQARALAKALNYCADKADSQAAH